MARTPDGPTARDRQVQVRLDARMDSALDSQRAFRGGMSRSTYVRWLIVQDGKRIAREKGE